MKTKNWAVRESQHLKALAAVAKDFSSVQGTHISVLNHSWNYSSRESEALSGLLWH